MWKQIWVYERKNTLQNIIDHAPPFLKLSIFLQLFFSDDSYCHQCTYQVIHMLAFATSFPPILSLLNCVQEHIVAWLFLILYSCHSPFLMKASPLFSITHLSGFSSIATSFSRCYHQPTHITLAPISGHANLISKCQMI